MIRLHLDHVARLHGLVLDTLDIAERSMAEFISLADAGHRWTGWFDFATKHGANLGRRIADWQQRLVVPYDRIVVCGIGGSFAGSQAIDALFRQPHHLPLEFAGHNLCEQGLTELLNRLRGAMPLVLVISKSGTTTEPALAFRVLLDHLQREHRETWTQRVAVITDPQHGNLGPFADAHQVQRFEIPPEVGGRFSALTAAGMVPLALVGHDVGQLQAGSQDLYDSVRHCDRGSDPHPVITHACLRHLAWESGIRIDALATRSPKWIPWVEWWKQLFGESEGKKDRGLFPVALHYTTDLHSMGQYLQEGWPQVLETFLAVDPDFGQAPGGVRSRLHIPQPQGLSDRFDALVGLTLDEVSQVAIRAATAAHAARGIPCLTVTMDGPLDLYRAGYLMAYFHCVCTLSARLSGVNPFDQPGVEAYKKNMFTALNLAQ